MSYIFAAEKPPLDEALLKHYGVKGMKWGVRRSQRELDIAAGRKPAAPKSETKKGTVGLDPVLVGVGAVAALALFQETSAFRDERRIKKNVKRNEKEGFKKNSNLTKKMTTQQLETNVVRQVNPEYPSKGTKNNCRRATMAYEMRRRGYDVKAVKTKHGFDQDDVSMQKAIKTNFKTDSIWGEYEISNPRELWSSPVQKRSEIIFDSLAQNPNGSRGELSVGWMFMGGHSVAWEIVNNKPVVFDAQNGKTYRKPSDFNEVADGVMEAAQTRLDNKTFDEDILKRWVTNV